MVISKALTEPSPSPLFLTQTTLQLIFYLHTKPHLNLISPNTKLFCSGLRTGWKHWEAASSAWTGAFFTSWTLMRQHTQSRTTLTSVLMMWSPKRTSYTCPTTSHLSLRKWKPVLTKRNWLLGTRTIWVLPLKKNPKTQSASEDDKRETQNCHRTELRTFNLFQLLPWVYLFISSVWGCSPSIIIFYFISNV